jgi:hypothetical protein
MNPGVANSNSLLADSEPAIGIHMQAKRQWVLFFVLVFTVAIVAFIVGSLRPQAPSAADVLLKKPPPGFVAVQDQSGPLDEGLRRKLGLWEPRAERTVEDSAEGYARTWDNNKGRSIVAIAWKFETQSQAGVALWIENQDAGKLKGKGFRIPGVPGASALTITSTKLEAQVHWLVMRKGPFLFMFSVTGRPVDRHIARRLAGAQHRLAPAGPTDPVRPHAPSFNWGNLLIHVFIGLFWGFFGLVFWLLPITWLGDHLGSLARWVRSLGRLRPIDLIRLPPAARPPTTQRWTSPVAQTVTVSPPSRGRLRLRTSSSSWAGRSSTSLPLRRIFRSRRPLRLIIWLALALVLVFVGLTVMVLFNPANFKDSAVTDSTGSTATGLSMLLAWLCFGLAARTYRQARRHAAPPAGEVMRRDPRPPVLYLRSFRDDHLKVRVGGPRRRSWLDSLAYPRLDRFEEVLAWNLWQVGPVVAPSLPGQKLPPLGAARAQLSEQGWRHEIEQWMRQAQVIVVVLGRTEGLAWEISRLLALDLWYKAILVVPPTPEYEVRRRWAAFRHIASGDGAPVAEVEDLNTAALVLSPALGPRIVAFSSPHHDELHYHLALKGAVRHLTEHDVEAEAQP